MGRAKRQSRSTSSCWRKPRSLGISLRPTWNSPGLGLADTLQGQKNYAEAAAAYNEATAQPTISKDLKSRCDLNSGKMYDLLNQRDMARRQYAAARLQDADSAQADSARRYLKSPFTSQ